MTLKGLKETEAMYALLQNSYLSTPLPSPRLRNVDAAFSLSLSIVRPY